MRTSKILLAAAALTVAVAVGTDGRIVASAATPRGVYPFPTQASCVKTVRSEVRTKSKMTIATDSPAVSPWFSANNPANGKGYESAVAYQIAGALGFRHDAVAWVAEPYAAATAPGAKPFDFDINEVPYSRALRSSVDLTIGYFNLNQSLVALRGARITTHQSPAQLKGYLYGAQTASPGLSFVRNAIRPTRAPLAYATLTAALAALLAHKVQAIATDTPEGQSMAQLSGTVQFAQFHTTGSYYALVVQRLSPITACLNTAVHLLGHSGELTRLSKTYLAEYNSVRFISP